MKTLTQGAGTSVGAVVGALTIAKWRVLAVIVGTLWVGAIVSGYVFDAINEERTLMAKNEGGLLPVAVIGAGPIGLAAAFCWRGVNSRLSWRPATVPVMPCVTGLMWGCSHPGK